MAQPSAEPYAVPKGDDGDDLIRDQCTECQNCRGFWSVSDIFSMIYVTLMERRKPNRSVSVRIGGTPMLLLNLRLGSLHHDSTEEETPTQGVRSSSP
jgi:hypothetical protein